jgi:hypothetical protein
MLGRKSRLKFERNKRTLLGVSSNKGSWSNELGDRVGPTLLPTKPEKSKQKPAFCAG